MKPDFVEVKPLHFIDRNLVSEIKTKSLESRPRPVYELDIYKDSEIWRVLSYSSWEEVLEVIGRLVVGDAVIESISPITNSDFR